jgi:arginase
MAISIAVGHCWRTIAESIPHYRALPEDRVLLVGARDFEPLEYQRLMDSEIAYLPCARLESDDLRALRGVLASLAERVDDVFIHIDLDVHDPAIAPANQYKPPGGMTPDQVKEVIRLIADHLPLCGATLAAYDPGADDQRKGVQAAREIVDLLCALLAEKAGQSAILPSEAG